MTTAPTGSRVSCCLPSKLWIVLPALAPGGRGQASGQEAGRISNHGFAAGCVTLDKLLNSLEPPFPCRYKEDSAEAVCFVLGC